MEAARAAVSKITGRTGHRTDVDEVVNPAVVSETVKPHRHEQTTEAIDREVHQHHYHTTVQPIAHQEVVPEKHVHNIVPQVEREFKHDNEADTHKRVSAELGQFQNTSTTHQTRHTREAAPQVVGEHVHHHVHETVQPVIHKETIQPEVVHTTVPIHETHHETAQHHGMSALPMKTLDEFTKAGGLISGGKSHTHEEYEGAPRPYNEKLKTSIENVLPGHHGSHNTTGVHNTTGSHNTTGVGAAGLGAAGAGYGASQGVGHSAGHNTTGLGSSSRRRGSSSSSDERKLRSDSGVGGVGQQQQQQQHTKPSLMDKLNPKVDANGDGKAGFMK